MSHGSSTARENGSVASHRCEGQRVMTGGLIGHSFSRFKCLRLANHLICCLTTDNYLISIICLNGCSFYTIHVTCCNDYAFAS